MPLHKTRPNDPRIDPGAYVTDGTRLYEVIATKDVLVTLENCETGFRLDLARTALWAHKLVRPAPKAPDFPDLIPIPTP